jgi:hypothetical protein
MKKHIVILLSVLLIQTEIVSAQKKSNHYLFNSFIFGSSLTVFDNGMHEPIYEMTWNVNAATSVGKRFWVGFQVLNLFVKSDYFDTKMYHINGLFTQFSVAPYSKFRPFIELSVNKGNYYFPSNSYYPQKGVDLYYVGTGGGADIPLSFISKHLFLDVSFIFYYLEGKGSPDDYNLYILGLNYKFGKMIRKPLTNY